MTVLGIRLNNPLCLTYSPSVPWAGLASPPNQGRFCVFLSPQDAFCAYAKELKLYIKRGHDTVPKFLAVWAPASENPTSQYVVNVLLWSRLRAAQILTIDDALPLFRAMCRQEDGSDPYPDSVITEGISMSNDTTPKALMTVTPTTAVAGAGGISYAITSLLVGAFHDFAHIDISADRQMAIALIIGVLIHHFFPKGDPAQS